MKMTEHKKTEKLRKKKKKKKYGVKFVNIVKQNFVSSKETRLVSFVILMVTDNFEERKKISLKNLTFNQSNNENYQMKRN